MSRPIPEEVRRRMVRIEAPHFVAGAEFERTADGWKCVRCAPILRRSLLGRTADEAARTIRAKRWAYSWLP